MCAKAEAVETADKNEVVTLLIDEIRGRVGLDYGDDTQAALKDIAEQAVGLKDAILTRRSNDVKQQISILFYDSPLNYEEFRTALREQFGLGAAEEPGIEELRDAANKYRELVGKYPDLEFRRPEPGEQYVSPAAPVFATTQRGSYYPALLVFSPK